MSSSGAAMPPGTPVHITDKELDGLTVAQIRAELAGRRVPFKSKQLKQEILDLLKAALHLPVVAPIERPVPKKKKKKKTSSDDDEYVDGEEPEDESQEEEPKEKAIAWNEYHPARKLLFDEITAGRITEYMGPAIVYYNYHDTLEFKIKGMDYANGFPRRLRGLRNIIKESCNRAARDKHSLKIALKNHPAPRLNHKGRPQWNGGVAQVYLKLDMALGKHLTQSPAELYGSRPEYQQALSPKSFRWKIKQMVGTAKCLHTLEFDAESKLRKNLKEHI